MAYTEAISTLCWNLARFFLFADIFSYKLTARKWTRVERERAMGEGKPKTLLCAYILTLTPIELQALDFLHFFKDSNINTLHTSKRYLRACYEPDKPFYRLNKRKEGSYLTRILKGSRQP